MLSESISLNKFISESGYCSRRAADQLIKDKRVLLNNKIAQLGDRYQPGDQVEVDGSILKAKKKEKSVYIAFNKPVGITTTSESHIAGNIISFINYPKRIFPIGRLDKDSEGLILLTNDGDIVNKILRVENHHDKEYEVKVHQAVSEGFAQKMSKGLPILGTTTAPCKIQMTGRSSFKITLNQGLNRQIRRMCSYLGYKVLHLKRTRIMHIHLGKLAPGKWRYLSDSELEQLHQSLNQTHTQPADTKGNPPKTKAPKLQIKQDSQNTINTKVKLETTTKTPKSTYKAYRKNRK